MKKKYTDIFIIGSIFITGLILGKLFDWGYFQLSREISIIEALTLVTTIGVAIYITKILEKEVQESRIKKDLYIVKISEFEFKLKNIEDLIEEERPSYGKINGRIHSCRLIKQSIFDNIIGIFGKNNSESITESKNKITLCLNKLKRLLTETPLSSGTENSDITLVNGIVNYSSSRIIEINTEVNMIMESLFLLKVKINHF